MSIRKQFIIDLYDELIVDNFAGGGGASTGIEIALNRSPDIAINHCKRALAMHQANHPQTTHYRESVWTVDIPKVLAGRKVGLLHLSPDCKHFSKAKGGKPRSKKIRGLAWVALKWVNAHAKIHGRGPRVLILENVEEFQTWAPLAADGSLSTWRTGWTFLCFVGALRRRGYQVEWRELRACDFGAPTIRRRLFLIARNDGKPIVWPEATHGPGRPLPYKTAADCIDWTLQAPSIFERARPLAEATCRRIAKGLMRYVVNAADPFIVNCANSKTTGRGPNAWKLEEPLRTITSAPGFALVAPVLTECSNGSNPRSMPADEPLRTICAETKGGHHALVTAALAPAMLVNTTGHPGSNAADPLCTVTTGGHHALVNAFLTKFKTGSVGQPITDPMCTVTANSFIKRPGGAAPIGLVTSHICKMRGENVGHATSEPLHTVSAQGTHHAEVRAFLIKYYGNEADGVACTEPMHTVTSRDRFGLVQVKGETYRIEDIGLRMLAPRELFRAQGFPENYIIDWGYFEEEGRLVRKPLTKTDQVRMCGNSVCPDMEAALVRANCSDMAAQAPSRKELLSA